MNEIKVFANSEFGELGVLKMKNKDSLQIQKIIEGRVSEDMLCHLVITLDAWQGCHKEGSPEENYYKRQFIGMIRALHLEGKISNSELWDLMDEVAEIVGTANESPT